MQTIRRETVQIGDSSIVFSVAGEIDRPALLLLHGWPHSRALYDGVLEHLSADFFVLAPDQFARAYCAQRH